MQILARSFAFAAVASLATSASALGQSQVVVVGGAPVVYVPRTTVVQRVYAPRTTVVAAPAPVVYSPRTVYVAAPAPVVYAPRTVVVPTTRFVAAPSPVFVTDPALTRVGYEVIRPNGRRKIVYPRRVVRYVN